MAKVVTIGGGTGTFVVLSGLKRIPQIELTALVSSSDDGGSTGHLRDAYGILPVGDARQALVALSENGTTLRELFTYRFAKGDVKGQNLGNLFLTALSDIKGSEQEALRVASRILRVRGKVIPSCATPTVLAVTLADGSTMRTEHAIDERDASRAPIQDAYLETPMPCDTDAKEALAQADAIILGPGDLYTSIIAALLPDGIKEAIATSPAKLIYVVNLFTKAGQSSGLSAKEHVALITRYAGRAPDCVVMHSSPLSKEALERYAKEGEEPVEDDLGNSGDIYRTDIASEQIVPPVPQDPLPRSLVRHDSDKLRAAIEPLLV